MDDIVPTLLIILFLAIFVLLGLAYGGYIPWEW